MGTQQQGTCNDIETVAEIANNYPRHIYDRAINIRKLENIIIQPGSQKVKNVCLRHFKDCLATIGNVDTVNNIFGPNFGFLKGKTVRWPNQHVEAGIDPVPRQIVQLH